MGWTYLLLAGLLEVCWVVGLKFSDGFTRPLPSAITLTGMLGSFWLLSLAAREIPLGTAYAIWTGIGAVGAAVIGMLFLQEPRGALRLGCIAMIVCGVVGLRMASAPH